MINLPIPSLEGSCSERLRFRKVCEADVEPWLTYINNPEAVRFMHLELSGIEAARQFLQWSFVRYERDGSGLHALELLGTGEFVGLCGLLTQEVDGKMELEIGYHLLPGQWHKGFATEAAVFCKAFAREKALAPSVISLIDPDNLPSQRVAERNGLQLERTTLFRGKPARVYRGLIGSVD
ncbi:MAG: GNAT family N-acetyltransferase [Flavobacteriales bacterium]|nr:GNAT family N-acetyltransferase [Flavobacteriales bacterium]